MSNQGALYRSLFLGFNTFASSGLRKARIRVSTTFRARLCSFWLRRMMLAACESEMAGNGPSAICKTWLGRPL